MNEAKKTYASKCKQKVVTFYKCDADLLDFANSINFQAFVKLCLKCELAEINALKSGEVVISLNEEDYGKTNMSNGKKQYDQIQGYRKLKGQGRYDKRNLLQISKRPTRKNDK